MTALALKARTRPSRSSSASKSTRTREHASSERSQQRQQLQQQTHPIAVAGIPVQNPPDPTAETLQPPLCLPRHQNGHLKVLLQIRTRALAVGEDLILHHHRRPRLANEHPLPHLTALYIAQFSPLSSSFQYTSALHPSILCAFMTSTQVCSACKPRKTSY